MHTRSSVLHIIRQRTALLLLLWIRDYLCLSRSIQTSRCIHPFIHSLHLQFVRPVSPVSTARQLFSSSPCFSHWILSATSSLRFNDSVPARGNQSHSAAVVVRCLSSSSKQAVYSVQFNVVSNRINTKQAPLLQLLLVGISSYWCSSNVTLL